MKNCLEKQSEISLGLHQVCARISPIIPPGAPQAILCEIECKEDPSKHYCTEDDTFCDTLSLRGCLGRSCIITS